jgi:CheY-like chemotaxis protein/anti-sigma regulatory factor (Ser/Thr protein kinase)
MIATAAVRAAGITKQLLAYARRRSMAESVLDVHQLVHETLAIFRLSLDPRVVVDLDLAAADPHVSGDAAQLQTALMNLCINAAHAMPEGGRLRISTRQLAAEDEAGADRLELAVVDTGTGIPPDLLPRIFDPFFTTKGPGKGSGLGLSSALGTVQQHGGTIEIESRAGAGTVMRIFLPVAAGPLATEPAPASVPLARGGRILVADDDPMVRRVVCRILDTLGYQAVAVADGAETVSRLRASPGAFDAAIIDMRMPVMGGRECFAALRAVRPDLPVIIASGYHDDQLEDLKAAGLAGILSKPYDRAVIGRALESVLAGRPFTSTGT